MRRRLAVLAALVAVGCAHSQPEIATLASNSDQIIWDAGQKALSKRQWETARQHFKRIIDGFPQSEFGAPARLALADSHFQEGGTANYILAVSEYREFLTYYPSHPRSEYARFQVGECFFKQRNGPDRDQTSTERAVEEYQRLLEVYSSSPYAEKARSRIVEGRQSLARAEFLAGFFYQRTRQAYRAAIGRYEGILSQYPDYQALDEVLFRLAECLALSGRSAEALPLLARLLEDYPKSGLADPARRLISQLSPKNPLALPSGTPAPVAPSPGPGTSP